MVTVKLVNFMTPNIDNDYFNSAKLDFKSTSYELTLYGIHVLFHVVHI